MYSLSPLPPRLPQAVHTPRLANINSARLPAVTRVSANVALVPKKVLLVG